MNEPPPGGGGLQINSPPRKKTKHKPALDSVMSFPSLAININPQENPKFVVMKSANPDLPLNKLNIFILSKALNGLISENNRKLTKFTRDGNLLILTKTKRQAELLIKTKKLSNICDITCAYHETLNTVKGVIYCPEIKELSENEIVSGLCDQNVTKVEKIKKTINRDQNNTPLHILHFDLYRIPPEIKIGFQLVKVDYYIPKPMQCKNCFKIGHTKKRCQGIQLCPTCSLTMHTGQQKCTEVKCINCNLQHQSTNKKCPKIIKKQEILKYSTINKTSIAEATEHINSNFTNDYFTNNSPIETLDEITQKETHKKQQSEKTNTEETNIVTVNETKTINIAQQTNPLNKKESTNKTSETTNISKITKSISKSKQQPTINKITKSPPTAHTQSLHDKVTTILSKPKTEFNKNETNNEKTSQQMIISDVCDED